MNNAAVELAQVLTLVLGTKVEPGEQVIFKNIPSWDSMKQIEIIMAVEEKFGVAFQPESIPVLTSQSLLLSAIEKMLSDKKC